MKHEYVGWFLGIGAADKLAKPHETVKIERLGDGSNRGHSSDPLHDLRRLHRRSSSKPSVLRGLSWCVALVEACGWLPEMWRPNFDFDGSV